MEQHSLSFYASCVTSRRTELKERIDALNRLRIVSENNHQIPSSWQDFLFRGCLDCLEQALKHDYSSREIERNMLWKLLRLLCKSNSPCVPDLSRLPYLIEQEMEKDLSNLVGTSLA